jgi:GT2 family glycosyltransferase
VLYYSDLAKDYQSFRKELERLRGQLDSADVLRVIDSLIKQLDHERDENSRKLNRLSENVRSLDSRLLNVENSHLFRMLHRASRQLRGWTNRGNPYARHVRAQSDDLDYKLWVEREALATPPDHWFMDAIAKLQYLPHFSVLLAVDRPRREWLETAIASILRQSYPRWEICICDDACAEPWVSAYLEEQARSDSRIHFVRSAQRMGPASSLNRAEILAGGDYIAWMDQHDVLSTHAFYYAAEALQDSRYEVLYADEDQLGPTGARERPRFKPDWSPDLLDTTNYLGRFLMVAKDALHRSQGFQSEFDGAHAYDLALRLAESRPSVFHIPRVLSSARPDHAFPEQERRAIQASLHRRGCPAMVEDGPDASSFRIHRKLLGTPLASLIICSRTARLLEHCLQSIDRLTAYPVREIVVVQHKTGDDAAMERLLERSHCVRVSHAGPFDFASMNNRGAQAASGEILVFVNDDVNPLCATWLNELITQAQRPEVGVVGAQLVYPSGLIQHAGIAVGIMDGTGHPHRGTSGAGFWNWSNHARNVSGVTGACMAIRRQVFEELSGFDTSFPVNYNDVDLCLRARQVGYEVIYEPAARLEHYESRTRSPGVSWQERELWHERWGGFLEKGDPYYSRHLARNREDCSLSDG